jgi:hypothetical protein
MKKRKSKLADFKLKTTLEKVAECNRNVEKTQEKIKRIDIIKSEIQKLTSSIQNVEDSWKGKLVGMLGANSFHAKNHALIESYQTELRTLDLNKLTVELIRRNGKLKEAKLALKQIQDEIAKQNTKKVSTKLAKIKPEVVGKIPVPQVRFVPPWRIPAGSSSSFIEVSWENVSFHDGSISIKSQGILFSKPVKESKAFLNRIKSYYVFKDVPRLKVKLSGSSITEIANEAVLFFHIKYLSVLGYNFGEIGYEKPVAESWSIYSREYYRKNLSFLFHTWSLQRLCEICDHAMPIVPAGEIVINSKGDRTIHNSFLFPIKCRKGYRFIWESMEESKASYVFRASSPELLSLQLIYEYIAGEYSNKRDTLIHSKPLQKKLNMEARIFHTSQHEWNDELNRLVR